MTLQPRLDDLLELRHRARTLGLASHHLVNSTFSGLYASVFRGTGLDFEEVREYYEGDDIRTMDWNVTARTNIPHLKVFREERERSVLLCVDKSPHMSFGTRGTFKSVQAARAASLLGWAANSLNDRVGGLLFGDAATGQQHFRPTKDRRALWRLLHALSQPGAEEFVRGDPLTAALKRAEQTTNIGSLVVVIGDVNRPVEHLEQPLGRICQRHPVALLPVDDPADRELPAMGRVVFHDNSGNRMEIDTDDPKGRRVYTEAWESRRRLLKAVANRLGILFIPLLTSEDVHLTLSRGLQRRLQTRAVR